ncbi:MAG TPA: hypothetical protein V6D26_16730 [Stenomitos sp.]
MTLLPQLSARGGVLSIRAFGSSSLMPLGTVYINEATLARHQRLFDVGTPFVSLTRMTRVLDTYKSLRQVFSDVRGSTFCMM